MTSESIWPIVKISDIKAAHKNAIGIGPFGSRMKSDCYVSSGIPVLRGTNIGPNTCFVNDFVYITSQKANELSSCNVFKDDLIFPHRGAIGEVGIVANDERYVLSSSLMKLSCDPKKALPKYVYYFFKSTKGRFELLKNSSQVGTPGIGQPLASLRSIELPLPTLEEQTHIVSTLSCLDDKIQINQKINQTLESIAQAIFKSWFVDFDPVRAKMAALEAHGSEEDALLAAMQAISGKDPEQLAQMAEEQPEEYAELKTTAGLFPSSMQDSELGEIPEGWLVAPLSTVAYLDTTAVSPASSPDEVWEHYSIPAFDNGIAPVFEKGSEIKSTKYRVHPYGVLSSKLNPHFPRTWIPSIENADRAICSTEFMQFVPHDKNHRSFLASLILSGSFQNEIMRRVTGSTGSRQRAQPKQVAEVLIVKPSESAIAAFCERSDALFNIKSQHIRQILVLTDLRDTLLPKLLSGELTVSDQPTTEALETDDV